MGSHYISKIEIHKLRHLNNINIELSASTRKNLIITGKNGVGKTTLLYAIGNYLISIENKDYIHRKVHFEDIISKIDPNSDEYDDILDCTKVEVDKILSFRITDTVCGKSEVKVEVLENSEVRADVEDDVVDMTVKLLNEIYAGTTIVKKLEAEEIRGKISEEMGKFKQALVELRYAKESGNQDDIKDQICLIESLLKARQPYAAFKRWYIKDNLISFPEIRLQD